MEDGWRGGGRDGRYEDRTTSLQLGYPAGCVLILLVLLQSLGVRAALFQQGFTWTVPMGNQLCKYACILLKMGFVGL